MRSADSRRRLRAAAAAAAIACVLALQGCGSGEPSRSGNGTFPHDHPPLPADQVDRHLPEGSPIAALSEESDWVDEVLSDMTLEEKIAQMICVRAYGYFQNDRTDRMRRLFELVERRKVGGVCLFQGEVHTSALLVNRLQEMSRVPLLVSSDFEWGAAMRIRRTTRYPEAMALGASRDTLLAYRMGRRIAAEARSMGIHQVYAPVADVNNNPLNPVINTRSFGENPSLVASMASAVARGLQDGGVIATAKHFPGHGDTDVDSHLGLPFMRHSRGRLDSVELVPFRRLVDDGVASVMIAHCDIPSLGDRTGVPATLSPRAVDSLLVNEMGFRGLIVTDAMDMAGLTKSYPPDSAAVLAVEAGVDVLLLPEDVETAMRGLLTAVVSGRITESRIERSVRKILQLKQWSGLSEYRPTDLAAISSVIAADSSHRLAGEIARSSVTLLKNDGLLPLGSGRKSIAHIIVSDAEGYRTQIERPDAWWPNERVGDYYAGLVRARWGRTRTTRLDPASDTSAFTTAKRDAGAAGTVLVSVFSKVRSGSGGTGLPDDLLARLVEIIGANPRTAVVTFGNPYILPALGGARAYLCAYSDAEATCEAVAGALFGENPTRGRLPVTLTGMAAYGSGILSDQLSLRRDTPEESGLDPLLLGRVDSVVTAAIADSAFPGAQLVAVRDNAVVIDRAYGRTVYGPGAPPVTPDNLFDIASMTKVFATTAAVMKLFDEGKISLDDRAASFIPALNGGAKASITIQHLLSHRAGFPPFKSYFLTCATPDQMLDSVYATDLVARPGDSTIYSDFGFIILGRIVEAVTGTTLDRYVDSVFYSPLGMSSTMYLPGRDQRERAVPTEFDSLYRHRLVAGEVHDENAYALGGVAGHAGLFATATDLAVFTQMILNGGTYGGVRYFRPSTVALFADRRDPAQERGLGWDFVSLSGYSSAGRKFGPKSFGHLGFTGTSVWVDPGKKIFIIFLTNRVYPTRTNNKIRSIRPAVYDAVMTSLGDR